MSPCHPDTFFGDGRFGLVNLRKSLCGMRAAGCRSLACPGRENGTPPVPRKKILGGGVSPCHPVTLFQRWDFYFLTVVQALCDGTRGSVKL